MKTLNILHRMTELRLRVQLSQGQLGKKLGLSQQTIGKYERGLIEPKLETLIALSQIFGVSIDYLLGVTNVPDKEPLVIPDPLYMKLAYEAENMRLTADDVNFVIDAAKRYMIKNENLA